MKKLLFILMGLCLLFSTEAFAKCDIDYNTNTIEIYGSSEAGKKVNLIVFNLGKSISDIDKDDFSNSVVVYNEQITSADNGEYKFDFKMYDSMNTGIYNYSIGFENGKTEKDSFHFVSKNDKLVFVEALNNAGTQTQIGDVLNTYAVVLNINAPCDNVTQKIITALYKDISNLTVDNFDEVCNNVYAAIEIANIANGTVTKYNPDSSMFSVLNNKIDEWFESERITETAKNSIISSLKKDYNTIAEFEKELIKNLVLSVVRLPNGNENLKKVISDFSSEIGLSASQLDMYNYREVYGKTYSTLEDLKNALNKKDVITPGGGGGGGGTSNRNSNKVETVLPLVGESVKNESQSKTIMKFTDLSTVEWAYESIATLAYKNIVSGKSETVFDPLSEVKREEFIKMVCGVLKLDIIPYNGEFNDISANEWYAPYVSTAYQNGICQGIGDGNFGAGNNISRQDMGVIIYNALSKRFELPEGNAEPFADESDISDYAMEAINALHDAEILAGSENHFYPKNFATRAEAAVLLCSVLEMIED